MSVWLDGPAAPLSGSEGALVSISIAVDARDLESLLETLAHVSFPVNPQIYHDAVTIVEFPAYAGQIVEVRETLAAFGFDPSGVQILDMLSKMRGETTGKPGVGHNPDHNP